MTIQELREKLVTKKVNDKTYSLDGTLLPDRIVLYKNYSKWEVFYFDERGGRHDEKVFYSENDACIYMYKKLTGEDIENPAVKQKRMKNFDISKREIVELVSKRMKNSSPNERETLNNISDVLQSYTFEDRFERKGILSSLITKGVVGGLAFNSLESTDIIIKKIFEFDKNIK